MPGSPAPRTAASSAEATSSWCTSWKRVPGSGRIVSGARRTSQGIASTMASASGPATMQGRKT